MKLTATHAFFASLLLATPALAQQPAAADATPVAGPALALPDALARLERARVGVDTLEAEFEQDRVMGLFAQALHSRGRLVVQRPDRVRWELVSPDPAVFIVANGRISSRTAGNVVSATQAQAGAMAVVLTDLAAMLGGSLTSLQSRFRLEARASSTGGIVLDAVPTDAAVLRSLSLVRLVFAPALRTLERIELTEPGGDRATIRLRAPAVNSGRVNAATFAP